MKRKFLKKLIITGMITLVMANLNYISASAKWTQNSTNDWNWIEGGDKVTGWKNIENKWYYFDDNGVMKTGWFNDKGTWYSLSNSGIMDTGWKKINEKWYHFDSEGKMSIGWINDNDKWYFTNSSGEMETGTLSIDGIVYNFSDNGQMLTSEQSNKEMKNASVDVSSIKSDDNSRIAYVSTNDDSLNVRSDAEISSDIIATLEKGTEVKITGEEKNGFYPLSVDGKKGWVSSAWISFKKSEDISNITNTSSNSSNTDASSINKNPVKLKDVSLGSVRDTQPDLNSKYYYSDDNLFYKVKLSPPFYSGGKQIKGNCTWYAWGRAWELTGNKPNDAGFIGNAYEWWGANQKSGKYQYGSEPRIGAIAVWKSTMPNSGGDGHVAIVEKIENGKIYISESTWNGVTFRYREIYDTNYMYGYIYLDKPNF